MTNLQKLCELMEDVLLLDDGEFSMDLRREDVEAWDSMATVAIGVGLEETFDAHPSEEEAIRLNSVADIMAFLSARGLSFD